MENTNWLAEAVGNIRSMRRTEYIVMQARVLVLTEGPETYPLIWLRNPITYASRFFYRWLLQVPKIASAYARGKQGPENGGQGMRG